MIRTAKEQDIQAIADTYTELLCYEQEHGKVSNWKLNVYPTIQVPAEKVPTQTMFVLEEQGQICASMVLNQEQAPEYREIGWAFPAPDEKVLVIHTLCVPPSRAKRGYGARMVCFAKQYAAEKGCSAIRLDTFAYNEPAKELYLKNGFCIAGYGTILLQGLIEEDQVYLEFGLPKTNN
jgi:ribosomal protein S18 acetylase RimI-like enzyme